MRSISDIPNIEDQDERFEEILVDSYGIHEQLASFHVYVEDAANYPFVAIWRDVDETGHAENVTVTGVYDLDDRRGVLMEITRGKKSRRVVAEQLWAVDEKSANATVLNDYRDWVNRMGGFYDDIY